MVAAMAATSRATSLSRWDDANQLHPSRSAFPTGLVRLIHAGRWADQHFVYAPAVHVEDFEHRIAHAHRFAGRWDASQTRQHNACQRCVLAALLVRHQWQEPTHLLAHALIRLRAVHQPGSIRPPDDRLLVARLANVV